MAEVHEIFTSGALEIQPTKYKGFLSWEGRKWCTAERRQVCEKSSKCQNLLDSPHSFTEQQREEFAKKAFQSCCARDIQLNIAERGTLGK